MSRMPGQTYTTEELAQMMHCHRDRVDEWRTCGLIQGIKSGKGYVYPAFEVVRFQKDNLGKDLSNLKAIKDGMKNERD